MCGQQGFWNIINFLGVLRTYSQGKTLISSTLDFISRKYQFTIETHIFYRIIVVFSIILCLLWSHLVIVSRKVVSYVVIPHEFCEKGLFSLLPSYVMFH